MKSLFAAAVLSVATALPAFAFDPANMSDSEKQAFGEAIRDYLMANPEVLVESVNVLESRRAEQQALNDKQLVEDYHDAIFADGHSWVGGNPDGDLTLVEFVDYRCGFCRQVNPELEALIKSDGNIRFIIKEFPILGPASEASSRFAVAVQQIAGPDEYKRAHDALLELPPNASADALRGVAEDLGLDPQPILDRMNSDEVTAVLQANHELAGSLGINGTPAFVIGPQLLRGTPQSGLAAAVAQIRAEAKG